MNDIVLIDKPAGITSFDVIRQLRRKTGIRKMGHAGTLDPAATGLMIIGINAGTKKLNDLIGLPKTYEATILLGTQTDTGDFDGVTINSKPVPEISESHLKTVLQDMTGELSLPVPKYSAIKRHGKPLYKYAREGKDIEIPEKSMVITWINFLSLERMSDMNNDTNSRVSNITPYSSFARKDAVLLTISLNVSSGTYIRSIAEELGKRLGTVATLASLRRTTIGPYSVADAELLN